jgi:hypothetical protein
MNRYTADDLHFKQVLNLIDDEGLDEDARCNLSFALAKMYEDIGEIDKSFEYLSQGNRLRKKLLKYSIEDDIIRFRQLKKVQPNLQKYSRELKKISGNLTPIFILGMPRSGTTLVEQIISSHSKVSAAGELDYISRYGVSFGVGIKRPSEAVISEFREKYLSRLAKLSNKKPFVTDKMPHNFCYIPLICAAFPEANIIHVQRDAAATCWSNYKHYFAIKGLGYSYDLKDVVAYYDLYKDLMKCWQSRYSDRIYNLDYEKLAVDQEDETRKLIKHIGLKWEDACLSPHKNKRSVRTASQQQVRQKVYQGSSQAWRKYEPFLNGAFDSLLSSS